MSGLWGPEKGLARHLSESLLNGLGSRPEKEVADLPIHILKEEMYIVGLVSTRRWDLPLINMTLRPGMDY